MTKTEEAAKMVLEDGMSVRAASRKMDISEAAVRLFIKKVKAMQAGRCSCCGAPIDANGKYIPRTGD